MKATFGTTIRAARMGYHPVEGVGFVRILAGGPPWKVNIRPFDDVKVEKAKLEHHVWWDGNARFLIEETIKRHIRHEVLQPCTLLLDDNGDMVGGGRTE